MTTGTDETAVTANGMSQGTATTAPKPATLSPAGAGDYATPRSSALGLTSAPGMRSVKDFLNTASIVALPFTGEAGAVKEAAPRVAGKVADEAGAAAGAIGRGFSALKSKVGKLFSRGGGAAGAAGAAERAGLGALAGGMLGGSRAGAPETVFDQSLAEGNAAAGVGQALGISQGIMQNAVDSPIAPIASNGVDQESGMLTTGGDRIREWLQNRPNQNTDSEVV